MKELLNSVENLKKSDVRKLVDQRLKQFKETGEKPSSEIFKELCFCLLTANFNAERSIMIQNEIGDSFIYLNEKNLENKLKQLGHRFPTARTKYIIEARKHIETLKERLNSFYDEKELREWFVKNVKGFNYKESSHFMRNIGYENIAIIDFHIIDVLVKNDLIEKPENLTKMKYIEIEEVLKSLAKKLNMSLAELDLYLWFLETGKVLK